MTKSSINQTIKAAPAKLDKAIKKSAKPIKAAAQASLAPTNLLVKIDKIINLELMSSPELVNIGAEKELANNAWENLKKPKPFTPHFKHVKTKSVLPVLQTLPRPATKSNSSISNSTSVGASDKNKASSKSPKVKSNKPDLNKNKAKNSTTKNSNKDSNASSNNGSKVNKPKINSVKNIKGGVKGRPVNVNNTNARNNAKKSKAIIRSIEPYVNPGSQSKSSRPNSSYASHIHQPIDSHTYQLYTDGSHMMEYNKAGIGGYLVNPQGKIVLEFSETIKDDKLHSKHEIIALEKGLLEASRLGVTHLKCYTDLEKMAQILNIRNPTMRAGYVQTNPTLERVNILLRRFEKIEFVYIPREQNKRADRLSRQVLLKETDKASRIVDNSINIKNLYCVQKYTREQREKFLDLKKDIRYYLAFNIEQRDDVFYIQTYEANKKNNKYVSAFVSEIKLNKNWVPQAIIHIAKMLVSSEKMFEMEEDFDKRQIIVAIKEKREIINYLLRGLAPVTLVAQKGIDEIESACQRWSKVVVHYEGLLMDDLFH